MTVSASKFLTACAASVLLAVALSACGGGGDGSAVVVDPMPEPMPDPMPDPVPGLESAIDRAADAFFRAGLSAIDAVAACQAENAACDAANDALAAQDRASAAYADAEAATTLADAERAALAAEQAAADAAAAAEIAKQFAMMNPVEPDPMPDPGLDPVQWENSEWLDFEVENTVQPTPSDELSLSEAIIPGFVSEITNAEFDWLHSCFDNCAYSGSSGGPREVAEYSEITEIDEGIRSFRARHQAWHSGSRYDPEYIQYGHWGLIGGYVALVMHWTTQPESNRDYARFYLQYLDPNWQENEESTGITSYLHPQLNTILNDPTSPSFDPHFNGRDLPLGEYSFSTTWRGKMVGAARNHDLRPIGGDVHMEVSFAPSNLHSPANPHLGSSPESLVSMELTNIGNGRDIALADILIANVDLDSGPSHSKDFDRSHDHFYNKGGRGDFGVDGILHINVEFLGPGFEEAAGHIITEELIGAFLTNRFNR